MPCKLLASLEGYRFYVNSKTKDGVFYEAGTTTPNTYLIIAGGTGGVPDLCRMYNEIYWWGRYNNSCDVYYRRIPIEQALEIIKKIRVIGTLRAPQ